jgi:pyruvate ferredoxin oxidoreductase gamma subunit
VVTAAEILSVAAFRDGLHAQAFPTFGSERTGAPVVAFCRIAEEPIRAHDPVVHPDVVVVQDPTLLQHVPVLAGCGHDSLVLVNSARAVAELDDSLRAQPEPRVCTVPATDIAREVLGRPLPNTALLGALVALTGVVSPDNLDEAIRARFPGPLAETNVRAAHLAAELSGRAGTPGPGRPDESEVV